MGNRSEVDRLDDQDGSKMVANKKAAPIAEGGSVATGGQMHRDGAIIFSDLLGKLDLPRVACDKRG